MRYDELISTSIKAIKEFDPKIEGPNSFVERFLKKITKDTNERMFIKQVFYGVLRYKDFLKVFTESLFNSKPSSTERKDETLFFIFAYITIFRLDELPLDDYKQLVLSQDSVKLNEFFTYLFDEDVLKNKLREEWIKQYDFNYVDNKIIGGLMQTKAAIPDVLEFVMNKARVGNLSSADDSTAPKTDTKSQAQSQPKAKAKPRQVTVPEPFNLTKPQPRVFRPPEPIQNKPVFKPVPTEIFKKSLKEIEEEKREARKKVVQKMILERHKGDKEFKFKSEERPKNFDKIKEEVEKKIESTLQFDKKYHNPPLDFSNIKADVKYNEAAIIREEHLIRKKEEEEKKELERKLVEKKDSQEFNRWVSEMKTKDEIMKMEKIQKRKLELELNREIAQNSYKQKIKNNQLKAAQHKQQELKNLKDRDEAKKKEIANKREVVVEINKEKENIPKQRERLKQQNQELYKNRIAEYNELDLIRQEEKKIEQQRRDDLIRQIRELEKIPVKRVTGFDPTETPGYGLLEEMSIVELRERLELQKKMHADEILAKREENKLKMEEKTDILMEKARVISDHRDKLRNAKEVERKKKKDEIKAKEELMRQIREKSLFEVKAKIENKKEQLRKEDEIFQKKIREIKLQRQFLQLGRAAVEEKAFKMIEDGLERKINDRQNQDLVDQEKRERVNWIDLKIKYNEAKKDVKQKTKQLVDYKNAYEKAAGLNDRCVSEDKEFKKAVHDRERALNYFQQQDSKERNKFSDALQGNSLKPKKEVVQKVEEDDEEDDEDNHIMNKLQNEREAVPA